MDFITNELKMAVAALGGLANTKSVVPAARCIKVVAGKMMATDLTTSYSVPYTMPIGADNSGEEFLIPPEAFGVIKKLESDLRTSITHDAAAGTLTIKCGRLSATFHTYPREDFPEVLNFASVKDSAIFYTEDMDMGELAELLSSVSYAVAVDAHKGVLCGIRLVSDMNGLRAIALDGFRLAQGSYALADATGAGIDIVVPATVVSLLAKQKRGTTGVLAVSGGIVGFKGDDYEICVNLFAGGFPDTDSIVQGASAGTFTVTCDAGDFSHALELFSVAVDSGRNNACILEIGENAINIKSGNNAAQRFEYPIDADTDAWPFDEEPFVIAFNSRYLVDALKPFANSDTISIAVKNPLSGATITRSDSEDGYLAFLLPVRLATNA